MGLLKEKDKCNFICYRNSKDTMQLLFIISELDSKLYLGDRICLIFVFMFPPFNAYNTKIFSPTNTPGDSLEHQPLQTEGRGISFCCCFL